jgi:hypothetical protein
VIALALWLKISATVAIATVGLVSAFLVACFGENARPETGEADNASGWMILIVAFIMIAAIWIFG